MFLLDTWYLFNPDCHPNPNPKDTADDSAMEGRVILSYVGRYTSTEAGALFCIRPPGKSYPRLVPGIVYTRYTARVMCTIFIIYSPRPPPPRSDAVWNGAQQTTTQKPAHYVRELKLSDNKTTS